MNQDLKRVIYSLHPLERKILPYLNCENLKEIIKESKLSEAETITALQLLSQKGYAKYEKKEGTAIALDRFGEKYAQDDLPEVKLLKELEDKEKALSELSLPKEEIGAALGELKRQELVEVRKEKELLLKATSNAKGFLKTAKNPLILFKTQVGKDELSDEQKQVVLKFKMRKGFLKEVKVKQFMFSLTPEGKKLVEEFTKNYKGLDLLETVDSDMLKTGSWKGKEFRHYDINGATSPLHVGRKHPMLKANEILKQVFVEMGFKEMYGPIVESALWNMDVMWIPQDHPARDEQDTFYLEGRADVPKDIASKVKEMHEKGIKQSHTPKGDWSEDTTRKRLLRTHSTSTTYRTLHELGERLKKGEDVNGKYFYLAPVFRNEAIDATHLAEFYQAEGFIIGDNLSLADLMGFVKEYYAKLGIHKIRFKPTYNPYTEPSMEAHYYDPKLKKWYALINSGIFRPETLKPLGLENKTIIAWGIGASRVATLLTGAQSMRDITGATCDFEWLKTRPVLKREVVRE